MNVVIRELQDSDTKAIAEILKMPSQGMSWHSPWTITQIQEELVRAWNRGCFIDGQLAAFLFARELDGGLEITNLGTHESFRRQGWMRQLLEELLRMRPKADLWLEVHEKNHSAIALYESLGFKEIGRRKRYYNDGSSALAMKRITLKDDG